MIEAMILAASAVALPEERMIPAFLTGERLLEICTSTKGKQCSMYVAGVVDGMFHAQSDMPEKSICGGNELDTRDASETVVQYLRDHPELKGKAAAVVVELALRPRLVCGRNDADND